MADFVSNFDKIHHGMAEHPVLPQSECFSEDLPDPGSVIQVLDQGEVDIEAHDLQSNLDATMLHDQRPALLVTGDGCQEIHPPR